MPEMRVLWIDDQVSIFTGLQSYLTDMKGLRLSIADSFEEADAKIGSDSIDLLLFDLILMSSAQYSSMSRARGKELVLKGIKCGIRNFVAYSVLSRDDVWRAWKDAVARSGVKNDGLQFERFPKGPTSVAAVGDEIARMLGLGVP